MFAVVMRTLGIVALVIGLATGPSFAQESDPAAALPIAIVDMTKVRQSSSALRSIAEQINAYRAEFQKDIQEEEASLREANQELSRQRTIVSAEAFQEARKEFEARVADVQRTVQQRKSDLEGAREVAMGELQQALNVVIAEIAQEKGLLLVLPRTQTILSAKSLEITDEVTERLNAQLPDITVPKPGQ
ncbi:MAG: OmpH family outer membrane protein [Rhodospirillales bacterium]